MCNNLYECTVDVVIAGSTSSQIALLFYDGHEVYTMIYNLQVGENTYIITTIFESITLLKIGCYCNTFWGVWLDCQFGTQKVFKKVFIIHPGVLQWGIIVHLSSVLVTPFRYSSLPSRCLQHHVYTLGCDCGVSLYTLVVY